MECLKAEQTQYKIIKCVGVGLTSQVYEALREDNRGWTQQKVALKIIRSKNDVSILRKEFQRLVDLDSNYCVKLLAWENLKWGPALVLEYVDGCTLDQLTKEGPLSLDMILEILVQVVAGLKHLHAHDCCHGDLNLKNIMIDRSGGIKLIDFGFQGSQEGEFCVTPEFASPERLAGMPPNVASDFFALERIAEKLINQSILNVPVSEISIRMKQEASKSKRKKYLGSLVIAQSQKSIQSTRIMVQKSKKNRKLLPFLLLPLFVLALLPTAAWSDKTSQLDIRGSQWFQTSINGLPFEYGPYKSNLRPGIYQIRLKSSSGTVFKNLELGPGQTLRLNLD